jgi:signal peptidase
MDERITKIIYEYKWIILFIGIFTLGYLTLTIVTGMFFPIHVVSSESMVPSLVPGDIIVVKSTSSDKVYLGDIIVYRAPRPYPSPIIHRVIDKVVEDSSIYFRTKGDNNPTSDPYLVYPTDIIGEYTGLRVPIIGHLILFLQSSTGIITVIILIATYFLFSKFTSTKKTDENLLETIT